MPAPIVGGIVASVGGGLLQASAQKKAASKAASAAEKGNAAATAAFKEAYEEAKLILAPYTTAGYGTLQAQLALLGYGGTPGQAAVAGTAQEVVPIFPSGARRGRRGTATSWQVGDKTFTDKAEAEAYAKANPVGGRAAVAAVSDQEAQRLAIERVKGGAQFEELAKQGEYGIMANAAATGGLRGGDTQAALAQFRPQMLQALITQQLQNLGGITSVGGNAAGAIANAAVGTGTNIGNAYSSTGQTNAQAAIAAGQANSNAIGGIAGTVGKAFGSLQDVGAGAGFFGSKWAF